MNKKTEFGSANEEVQTVPELDKSIAGVLRVIGEEFTNEQVKKIRDNLTFNLFPDMIDHDIFESVVWSMFSIMMDRG